MTMHKHRAWRVISAAVFLVLLTCLPVSCGEERFGGTGLHVGQLYDPQVPNHRGCLVVLAILPDTPAAQKDIKPGDLVMRINNQPTQGHTFKELVENYMRGTPGTEVTLTIKRLHTGENIITTLKRARISPGS